MSNEMRWFIVIALVVLGVLWTAILGNIVLDNYVDRCWKSGHIPQPTLLEGQDFVYYECK